GTIDIGPYGWLGNVKYVNNRASGVIDLGSENTSVGLGVTTNEGRILVNSNSTLTVTRPAGLAAGLAFDNKPNALFSITAVGTANVNGELNNQGTLRLANHFVGARLNIGPGNAPDQKRLYNAGAGTIEFTNPTGPDRALVTFTNSNLENFGMISGKGEFRFTQKSSMIVATGLANYPNFNLNSIRVSYDRARDGANFVTFEAGSRDQGAVWAGLNDAFAIDRLCITGGSK